MNTKLLNIIFAVGAILILVSSVMVMENILYGKYVFASGVFLFFISRLKMTYSGTDFRLKRLNRLYFLSSLALVIASCLQFRGDNSWIVLLLIVAILEFYTSMRASVYEKSNTEAVNMKDADSDEYSSDQSLKQ
ncbi:MAG: hypothetical protein PHS30_06110 [Bacteroidales bacterium]|nr:hypothetical protein [Bacteroidales bacterium]